MALAKSATGCFSIQKFSCNEAKHGHEIHHTVMWSDWQDERHTCITHSRVVTQLAPVVTALPITGSLPQEITVLLAYQTRQPRAHFPDFPPSPQTYDMYDIFRNHVTTKVYMSVCVTYTNEPTVAKLAISNIPQYYHNFRSSMYWYVVSEKLKGYKNTDAIFC